ncbi:DsrE family protein [Micrococcus luteus]|uniref:DsrE family protein n=1 Tax=Bacillus subtilis TaxID=1423 RepID=UPI001C2435D6|nr:DsrE family protein [Micrococcus luteus]
MKKIAIIVHASESELGRALHSLLYAQELHEAGNEVKVIFDGAGTVWVKNFEDPANKYNPLYKAVKNLGVIAGVCEYCAGAFGVSEDVQASGLATMGERDGHPSVAQLIAADFQIITL